MALTDNSYMIIEETLGNCCLPIGEHQHAAAFTPLFLKMALRGLVNFNFGVRVLDLPPCLFMTVLNQETGLSLDYLR